MIFSAASLCVLAATVLALSYVYSRRTGCDLQSSYIRVLLIVAKWFGLVLAVAGAFIAIIDLLFYWYGRGDIGTSPWVFVVFGSVAVVIGYGFWKFFGAWYRHDVGVGRI
jgi:hypothetical protein